VIGLISGNPYKNTETFSIDEMKHFISKHEQKISRISTIVIFLALVRTISEPIRLHYYSSTPVCFVQIKPFLIGALLCATGLFAMTVLSFYARFKTITLTAVLVIVAMLIVKYIYLHQ
jgi:hypothetical protein